MRMLARILIALSVIGFIFAVVAALMGVTILKVTPAGFSLGCTNLAVIAIAFLLAWKEEKGAA